VYLEYFAVKKGRILTPPPERRIYPAAPVLLARLPDESGVPVGRAASLGGGVRMRPRVIPSVFRVFRGLSLLPSVAAPAALIFHLLSSLGCHLLSAFELLTC
jgi:hypothetical protein